jgi:DNA-binding NarL/FixJ family response regulator
MRFAIIDDHPLVFDALSTIVAALGERPSIQGFGTLTEFEAACERGDAFDLLLLDLGIPGYKGLEALERVRALQPVLPVVVLSASEERATILGALDLGAMGFIPKTARRDVLMRALELVIAGGIYIPPQVLETSGEYLARSPAAEYETRRREAKAAYAAEQPNVEGLTPRQRDVLALLVQGMPNKVICRELDLSPNPVKSPISAIFRALNATNRTQAVIAAQKIGLRVDYRRAAGGSAA